MIRFRFIQLYISVLHNSFRGYPLQGKIYNIPEVYEGLILHESNKTLSEDTDRNLHLKGAFNKITYWNWDKVPSKNDAFDQALDWIDIAEAVSNFNIPIKYIFFILIF